MKGLAHTAKDLQKKRLTKNIRIGDSSGPLNNKDNLNEESNEDNEYKFKKEYAKRSIWDIVEKTIYPEIPGNDDFGFSKQLYKCKECEAIYKSKLEGNTTVESEKASRNNPRRSEIFM